MSKLIGVLLFSVLLTACASVPRSSDLEGIPVVPFGERVPDGKEYILFFRAGEPINTRVNIHGNIFAQEASTVLRVTLKKDIYVYKDWISYDRLKWVDGDSALGLKLIVKIPGPEHPESGLIDLQMFEKLP